MRNTKIGQLLKVKTNTSGHNYTIGKKYKIKSISSDMVRASDVDTGLMGNHIREIDFDLIYSRDFDINRIKDIENEIYEVNQRRNFLKSNNLESCDEKTYILSMIDDTIKGDKASTEKLSELTELFKKIL